MQRGRWCTELTSQKWVGRWEWVRRSQEGPYQVAPGVVAAGGPLATAVCAHAVRFAL